MKKMLLLLMAAALLLLAGCGYILVEDLSPTVILAPTPMPEAGEAP